LIKIEPSAIIKRKIYRDASIVEKRLFVGRHVSRRLQFQPPSSSRVYISYIMEARLAARREMSGDLSTFLTVNQKTLRFCGKQETGGLYEH